MKTEQFKIWVTIEKITNPGTEFEEYEEAPRLPQSPAEFDTLEEAEEYIRNLI